MPLVRGILLLLLQIFISGKNFLGKEILGYFQINQLFFKGKSSVNCHMTNDKRDMS